MELEWEGKCEQHFINWPEGTDGTRMNEWKWSGMHTILGSRDSIRAGNRHLWCSAALVFYVVLCGHRSFFSIIGLGSFIQSNEKSREPDSQAKSQLHFCTWHVNSMFFWGNNAMVAVEKWYGDNCTKARGVSFYYREVNFSRKSVDSISLNGCKNCIPIYKI